MQFVGFSGIWQKGFGTSVESNEIMNRVFSTVKVVLFIDIGSRFNSHPEHSQGIHLFSINHPNRFLTCKL